METGTCFYTILCYSISRELSSFIITETHSVSPSTFAIGRHVYSILWGFRQQYRGTLFLVSSQSAWASCKLILKKEKDSNKRNRKGLYSTLEKMEPLLKPAGNLSKRRVVDNMSSSDAGVLQIKQHYPPILQGTFNSTSAVKFPVILKLSAFPLLNSTVPSLVHTESVSVRWLGQREKQSVRQRERERESEWVRTRERERERKRWGESGIGNCLVPHSLALQCLTDDPDRRQRATDGNMPYSASSPHLVF